MKFSASMVDVANIRLFSKILGTIGRLAKTAALRLTPKYMYFIFNERITSELSSLWCEISQEHLFADFNLIGVTAEQNEIYLEFTIDNLATAFKSAYVAKSVKLKLLKRTTPCLRVEIELPSMMTDSRTVVHDVPVSVIPRRFWPEFSEPIMPQFDVSLYMPSLKLVRCIVERMKNISNTIIVAGSTSGSLVFKIAADVVLLSTSFKELESTIPCDTETEVRWAEVQIDIRKIHQFLFAQQVNPDKVICNISHGKTIQFFLLHDDVSVQYFLPAVDPS